MPGNARDGNPTAVKLNPSSSKSSSELEEMRQLFKSNRESLRSVARLKISLFPSLSLAYDREFENSPDLRRPRVHFAGIPNTRNCFSSAFMSNFVLVIRWKRAFNFSRRYLRLEWRWEHWMEPFKTIAFNISTCTVFSIATWTAAYTTSFSSSCSRIR